MNTSDSIIILPLTQGQYAFIDAIDADLAEFKWNARKHHTGKFYAVRVITINGKRTNVRLHRVILERKLNRALQDGEMPDHENRNPLDNTRKNLRVLTHSHNNFNSDTPKNNTSGIKGVYWDKSKHKWSVQIGINGKRKKIGSFVSFEDAVKARQDAEMQFFGENLSRPLVEYEIPSDVRARTNDTSGENNGSAKLTWEQVREIRQRYVRGQITQKQLAYEYGVDQGVISAIILYKNWKE